VDATCPNTLAAGYCSHAACRFPATPTPLEWSQGMLYRELPISQPDEDDILGNLVGRANRGSAEAFAELADRVRSRVRAWAARVIHDDDDAVDQSQDDRDRASQRAVPDRRMAGRRLRPAGRVASILSKPCAPSDTRFRARPGAGRTQHQLQVQQIVPAPTRTNAASVTVTVVPDSRVHPLSPGPAPR
jgi:hypothetical protein